MMLALGLCAACTFKSELPSGTEFYCTRDADCPADTACQRTRQRCVPSAALDLTPPALVPGSEVVRIKPGPGNPLTAPAAATFGSTVELAFSVTEPLASITLAAAQCGAACAGPAPSGTGYVITCSLPAGSTPVEGPCALSVSLFDLEGNEGSGSLAPFVIDATAPAPPDTATPGRVVFRRVPWGVDGGPATESVIGAPGAASQAVQVILRSNGLVRGVLPVGTAGDFSASLSPLGVVELEVAAVDGAGNTSAFAAVRDGEWVATLGQQALGNPHRLEGYSVAGETIARRDAVEFDARDGLAVADGVGPSLAGGLRWRRGEFTPGQLYLGGRSVFDPAHGKVVNFGGAIISSTGIGNTFVFGNTATNQWVGTGWESELAADPEGDGQPTPRGGHVMVYDPTRRVVVLHGGTDYSSANSTAARDTWAWNGESWRRLTDGPPLTGATAFWSTRLSKMVVSGGSATPSGSVLTTTWTFDGRRWEELDAGFPARPRATSVWSPAEGAGLMFAGGSELWRFELDHWEAIDAGVAPPFAPTSTLLWNSERDAVWLVQSNSIWEWSGAQWSFVTDAGPSGEQFAYDGRRAQLIGVSAQFDPATTRVMTDAGVATLDAGLSVAELAPAVACDESLGGCVRVVSGGVYQLDPSGWRRRGSAPVAAPLALEAFGGGALAVMRESDGGLAAWDVSPALGFTRVADPPGATGAFGFAITSLTPWSGELLLTQYDGTNASWNGTSWSPRPAFATGGAPATVGPLSDGGVCLSVHPIVIDPIAAYNYGADLSVRSATGPLLAGAGSMMLDPERGTTFHYGGLAPEVSSAFLAQVDGGWVPVRVGFPDGARSPGARYGPTMRFDPVNRRGVLVGGATAFAVSSTNALRDTWLLETANERPGAVFRVSNAALGVAPAHVTGLAVLAVSGGSSELGDGGVGAGTRTALWSDGRFQVAPTESAAGTPQQPAPTVLEVTDRRVLERLLLGQPEVLVGVTPRGTNGKGVATLTVDYVELTVRYRLP